MRIKPTIKNLFILLTLFVSCHEHESKDFSFSPLHPVTYEFKAGQKFNRIDYFYVDGAFSYKNSDYEKLQNKIDKKIAIVPTTNYDLYSVYIYKKTDVINKTYTGGREGLDGRHQDIIAYIRYSEGHPDIFYIIQKGNVVYDLLSGQREDFEFDQ